MWIRDTAEDTILENVGPNRDERIMVPRGTRLVVDGIGLREFHIPVRLNLASSLPNAVFA